MAKKRESTPGKNLAREIRQLAEDDDRSLSQYINIVLKKHIENKNDR